MRFFWYPEASKLDLNFELSWRSSWEASWVDVGRVLGGQDAPQTAQDRAKTLQDGAETVQERQITKKH